MINPFNVITGKTDKRWKTVEVTKYAWHISITVPFDECYRYSQIKQVRLQRVGTKENQPSYREILNINNVEHSKLLTASLYQYNLQCAESNKHTVWDRGVGLLFPDKIKELSVDRTIYDIGWNLAEQMRRFEHVDLRTKFFI